MSGSINETDEGAKVLHIHEHRNPDHEPIAIKLIKNTKGYGWEISIKGQHSQAVLAEVETINDEMEKKYLEMA